MFPPSMRALPIIAKLFTLCCIYYQPVNSQTLKPLHQPVKNFFNEQFNVQNCPNYKDIEGHWVQKHLYRLYLLTVVWWTY